MIRASCENEMYILFVLLRSWVSKKGLWIWDRGIIFKSFTLFGWITFHLHVAPYLPMVGPVSLTPCSFGHLLSTFFHLHSILEVLKIPKLSNRASKGIATDKSKSRSSRSLFKCLENWCKRNECVDPESTRMWAGYENIGTIPEITLSAVVAYLG